MVITERQKAELESLSCERLSSDESTLREIGTFDNYRNEDLAGVIKGPAFNENVQNVIAYYLVKDRSDNILFYFSLKCGSLYDYYFDTNVLNLIKALYSDLLKREQVLSQQNDDDEEDKHKDKKIEIEIIKDLLESLRSRKGVAKADLEKIKEKTISIEEFENLLSEDRENVGKTYAGIELVHFCKNDNIEWKCPNSHHKIGTIVFWKFIVQKVLDVMKLVGCEYLFLFSADLTPDEELVNYYKTSMGFSEPIEKKTLVPLYDIGCKFLYQKTSDLENKRAEFFDNFNLDEDAV